MLPLETKIPFIHHILFSVGLQIRKILMWKYIFLSAMRERKKHTVYALTLTDFKVIKPRNQFQVTTECNTSLQNVLQIVAAFAEISDAQTNIFQVQVHKNN